MSLGNLEPGAEATVVVKYAAPCGVSGFNASSTNLRGVGIEAVVPVALFPRYSAKEEEEEATGTEPATAAASAADKKTKEKEGEMLGAAQVTMRFRSAAPITKVKVEVAGAETRILEGGKVALVRFQPPRGGATADYRASAVTSAACAPETAVETWPTSVKSKGGPASTPAAALGLSLVPNAAPGAGFANGPRTEVTFVADCSGSMRNQGRMSQMKNTLQLALRALPPSATFQVLAFGSKVLPCFHEGARPYDQAALAKARTFVASMKPSLGGTRILTPLRVAAGALSLDQVGESGELRMGFAKEHKGNRRTTAPRPGHRGGRRTGPGAGSGLGDVPAEVHENRSKQVVLLTDGAVRNTAELVAAAGGFQDRLGVRVFTIGIGAGASEALVKGVAEASKGAAEMVRDKTRLQPVVARAMQRVLSPGITGLNVDWGALAPFIQHQAGTNKAVYAG